MTFRVYPRFSNGGRANAAGIGVGTFDIKLVIHNLRIEWNKFQHLGKKSPPPSCHICRCERSSVGGVERKRELDHTLASAHRKAQYQAVRWDVRSEKENTDSSYPVFHLKKFVESGRHMILMFILDQHLICTIVLLFFVCLSKCSTPFQAHLVINLPIESGCNRTNYQADRPRCTN